MAQLEEAAVCCVQTAESPSFLPGFKKCILFGVQRGHKGEVVPSRRPSGRWAQALCYLHVAEMSLLRDTDCYK